MLSWLGTEALARDWSVSLIKSTLNRFPYQVLKLTLGHYRLTQIDQGRVLDI